MVETGTTAYQDADLVAGLRARDEAVFARLVDQWGASMQRVARGHVASDAIAEEVVQDTWVAVLHAVDADAQSSRASSMPEAAKMVRMLYISEKLRCLSVL